MNCVCLYLFVCVYVCVFMRVCSPSWRANRWALRHWRRLNALLFQAFALCANNMVDAGAWNAGSPFFWLGIYIWQYTCDEYETFT